MHRFTVDYSKDRPDRRVLMDRGFFLHGLPRLIALCRLLGHKPTVDGYNSKYGREEERRARWVFCGRCGIRTDPQGVLDPNEWDLGQPYTGPVSNAPRLSPVVRKRLAERGLEPTSTGLPGPWPKNPTSAIGAQVIIGRSSFLSIGFKVGSGSSEQCLAANISLGPLGAIYVHTEDHGQFIQRWLNGSKDLSNESRETGISIWHGRLEWKLWAPRDSRSKDDPWWMRGSIHLDPRHYLLGGRVCDVEKLTEKTDATVTMPDGSVHAVQVRLERWTSGRKRGRKTVRYEADWSSREGIPVRFDNAWYGSGVTVPEQSVDNGQWIQEACTQIAAQCTKERVRNDYQAPESV